jgi:hypothetical protein
VGTLILSAVFLTKIGKPRACSMILASFKTTLDVHYYSTELKMEIRDRKQWQNCSRGEWFYKGGGVDINPSKGHQIPFLMPLWQEIWQLLQADWGRCNKIKTKRINESHKQMNKQIIHLFVHLLKNRVWQTERIQWAMVMQVREAIEEKGIEGCWQGRGGQNTSTSNHSLCLLLPPALRNDNQLCW